MKAKSLPKLKKDLDKVFSIFIRLRVANSEGIVKCFTCGKYSHWKNGMQCGHYISRRHLSTRFDEKNCQVQCEKCNLYDQGNAGKFAMHLIEEYGSTILRELDIKRNNKSNMGRFEYIHLINHYKNLIK